MNEMQKSRNKNTGPEMLERRQSPSPNGDRGCAPICNPFFTAPLQTAIVLKPLFPAVINRENKLTHKYNKYKVPVGLIFVELCGANTPTLAGMRYYPASLSFPFITPLLTYKSHIRSYSGQLARTVKEKDSHAPSIPHALKLAKGQCLLSFYLWWPPLSFKVAAFKWCHMSLPN